MCLAKQTVIYPTKQYNVPFINVATLYESPCNERIDISKRNVRMIIFERVFKCIFERLSSTKLIVARNYSYACDKSVVVGTKAPFANLPVEEDFNLIMV